MGLSRTLEPEAMDTPEEAREYNDMDHRAVNRAFVDDLLAAVAAQGLTARRSEPGAVDLPGESSLVDVLDLGTGTAQIPIELCRRWEGCRVLATDMAISMLELAIYNIEVASLTTRIELRHEDAKQLPYPDQMFDLVMSNSLVHHVADPSGVFQEALRVTRPGGLLFFRDLARPGSTAEVRELVEQYAGEESEMARQLFEQSLHAALTVAEVQQLLQPLGCDPADVRMISDRHWTWSAIKARGLL